MKLLRNINLLLLGSLALASCVREYDAPPLKEPAYTGPAANVTIAQLRNEYAAATQDQPITIEKDEVLKAYVSGNDQSGNIYKTMYLQDATAGISILVDQGDVYSYYPVGQEVYINLKGMCISVYGEEQQIGHPTGYLYRTPWSTFQEKVLPNKWANEANVAPLEISDISIINTDVNAYKFKLVKLTGVTFTNGGTGVFASTSSNYTTETLKDAQGNSLDVRTSQYADFASQTLPEGKGTVIGILGRFKGAWQLIIRSSSDVYDFIKGEETTPEPGEETEKVLLNETFGKPSKNGNYWPYVKDYTGWDTAGLTVANEDNNATVRDASGGNIWFPYGKEVSVSISNIASQGVSTATLEIQVAANLYNDGDTQNLNAMKVFCNDVEKTIPSTETSKANGDNNKPYKFTFENISLQESNTLKFSTGASENTKGLRLYSVRLYGKTKTDEGGSTIIPTPNN